MHSLTICIQQMLDKVSAAMEAVDHWHAEHASLEVIEPSYRQLMTRANV